jgi:hypothetical protein
MMSERHPQWLTMITGPRKTISRGLSKAGGFKDTKAFRTSDLRN